MATTCRCKDLQCAIDAGHQMKRKLKGQIEKGIAFKGELV
jgi:hypothetical protein